MQETTSLWDNGLCLTSKSIVAERLMASTRIILKLRRPVQRRIARLAQRTRHKTVFRRCQILLALGRQQTPEAIAVALNCHVSTVYRTRQAFVTHGEESLPVRKSPGRPCKVTPADEQQLTAALQQEPRVVGKNFSNWTAQKLKVHLRWTVHPVTVWRHMRRQRWRWHRPVPRVASPDHRYGAKARYVRRLRAQARRGEIHLYYADEMDVALLPTISGRWMRQGQQTQVNTPGQNAKQYVFGASATSLARWSGCVAGQEQSAFGNCCTNRVNTSNSGESRDRLGQLSHSPSEGGAGVVAHPSRPTASLFLADLFAPPQSD
jgi:transposase